MATLRLLCISLFIVSFQTACLEKAQYGIGGDPLNSGTSAGGTVWNPSFLQGLVAWIDTSSVMYQDSGCSVPAQVDTDPVACVRGSSANRLEFTTIGSRPEIETRAGQQGLYFDGNDSLENLAAAALVNGATGFEVIAVVQSDRASQDRCFFDVENSDNRDDVLSLRYDSRGLNGGCTECLKIGIQTDQGNTQTEAASGIQSTGIQALGASWNSGNTITTYASGVAAVSHTRAALTGSLQGAQKMLIGDGSKRNWQGMIYELLYFERELSAAERSQVMSYLDSKWGPL